MYKLLIVDDNNLQLRTLDYYINRDKYDISEIRVAHDASEGISICRDFLPDIVITDIVMPGMTGVEMIKAIQDEGINPIFICMSCYDDFEYIHATMKLGVLGYLLKPINEDKIDEVLSAAIQRLSTKSVSSPIESKSLKLLREIFLYNIIHSKKTNTDMVKTISQTLHLDKYHSFILIKFILNQINEHQNVNSILQRITENMTLQNDGIIVLDDSNNESYLLMMSDNENTTKFMNETITALNENFTNIKQDFNVNCHALIVQPHNSLFDIQSMLYQLNSISLQGLNNTTQPYRIYDAKNRTSAQTTINLKKEIEKLIISTPSRSQISDFVDSMYPTSQEYSKDKLAQIYSEINVSFQLFFSEYHIDINELFNENSFIGHNISRFNDINRLKIWLKNILLATVEYYKKEHSPQSELLKNIIAYINNNYTTITNIDDVAKAMYISKSYARNIFKKHTGQTIIDYIATLRIDDAKRMLSSSSASIKDISEMVGYKSVSHFRSVFQKTTGMSVSDFRDVAKKKREHNEET